MHLLAEAPRAPGALCDMVSDGALGLLALDGSDVPRMKQLMQKYRDLPIMSRTPRSSAPPSANG